MGTKELKAARADLAKSIEQLTDPADLAQVKQLVDSIVSRRSYMAAFSASVKQTAEAEQAKRAAEQAKRAARAAKEQAAKEAKAKARNAAKPSPWLAIHEVVKSMSK